MVKKKIFYIGGSSFSPKPPQTKKRKRGRSGVSSRKLRVQSPKGPSLLEKCKDELKEARRINLTYERKNTSFEKLLKDLKIKIETMAKKADLEIDRLNEKNKELGDENERLNVLLGISKNVAEHATNRSITAGKECVALQKALDSLQDMISKIPYGNPASPLKSPHL